MLIGATARTRCGNCQDENPEPDSVADAEDRPFGMGAHGTDYSVRTWDARIPNPDSRTGSARAIHVHACAATTARRLCPTDSIDPGIRTPLARSVQLEDSMDTLWTDVRHGLRLF